MVEMTIEADPDENGLEMKEILNIVENLSNQLRISARSIVFSPGLPVAPGGPAHDAPSEKKTKYLSKQLRISARSIKF